MIGGTIMGLHKLYDIDLTCDGGFQLPTLWQTGFSK